MKTSSARKGTKLSAKPRPTLKTKDNKSSANNVKLLGIQPVYRVTYDPNFHPDDFIQHCREGSTRTEICAAWGVNSQTVLRWSKKYPEFKSAFRLGKEAHSSFYIKKLRDYALKLDNGRWGAVRITALMWYMKNTMNWGDAGNDEFKGDNSFDYSLHDQSTDTLYDADLKEIQDTDELE